MTYFYRFLLLWAEFDLAIANSTGRNPDNIAQLQKEFAHWEHELLIHSINGK